MSSGSEDHDLRVDIAFDCQVVSRHHKPARGGAGGSVWIANYSATVQKPTTGTISVPHGLNLLCVNYSGALLARLSNAGRIAVLPPRSLAFVKGGTRGIVQAARGEHSLLLATCPVKLMPAIESWMQSSVTDGLDSRAWSVRPIDPLFVGLIERLEYGVDLASDLTAPLVVGAMHEAAVSLLSGPSEMHLAALPAALPDTISELVQAVRDDPAQSWPLKDAADRAGYSPFHFSRVFKSLVGYGFHEYVDRCRTEAAVSMLVSTDSPVDGIAATAGFGTTQGFRESVKEYLGLVPSELRSLPESFVRR